jgi:hypothetical protein
MDREAQIFTLHATFIMPLVALGAQIIRPPDFNQRSHLGPESDN